ncbi:hypothetical protein CEP51_008971 [Fusarium floridanum]|uniref:Xylanolytic transcriptional activator regulatory domain-containing protein n=1 Tax=Fusarium floridanum TaxID=1325733 RepID=A0A428RJ19_9HYPO|nr:hypothetical protein CEP51_008971 [Fusarium floridanum]
MPYDGGQFVPVPGASTPIPLALSVPVPVPGHSHIHAHHPHSHPHALPSHPHHAHVHARAHASAGGPFGAMEQIETQASDLRFLAQVPVLNATPTPSSGPGPGVGPGGTPGGTPGVGVGASAAAAAGYDTTPQPQTQASPGSASVGENSAPSVSASNANKRKSLDDGSAAGKQTRSKRNRRCGNLNLACLYAPNCCSNNFKDSDDFKQVTAQLGRLQDEVVWLHQTVKVLQSESTRLSSLSDRPMAMGTSTVAPSPSQSSSSLNRHDGLNSKYGSFRGPTSMAFSLDVANNTISNMGYRGISDGDENAHHNEGLGMPLSRPLDPLHDFDKDEMVRLCRLHEEEIGIMYPVLNVQNVISHAKTLAPFLETMRHQNSRELINDEKTLQLKIIMCCALVVEEHGHSDKAIRLYDSMESVLNRKLMAEAADVAALPLLALVAGYRFLSNDEVLAWRVMGQVARLCLELGIHQRTGLLKIQDEEERKNALTSFWSAYVLDRRWAFGTGLPYVVQDEEIDSQLPFPDEYPYLVAMITYSRIGAKVWRQVSHFGPVLARDLRSEELESVDQELLQWYEQIPEEVKVRNWDKEKQITSTPSYNLQRLRIWTYLRLNQMRIWLYTPVLHSATSIMAHPSQSERVVDIAKDTIRYLNHLNNTTNLYRRVQVFYHQFLTSAIAVVFLASVHAPVRFSATCREEFYMALELVKDLSAKSWASQRLWRTIRSLKDVAPRFGLDSEDDPQSTAALGMIGLARGQQQQQQPFRKPSIPGQQSQAATPDSMAQNGSRIGAEMSRMFEGYVGLNGFQYNGNEEQQQQQQQQGPGSNTDMSAPETPGGMYGSDGTVFPHFREMY